MPRKGLQIAATRPGPCQLQLSALLRQLSSETVGPAPLSFLGLPHARALSERAPTRCRNPPTAPFCSPILFPQKEMAPCLGPQRGPIFEPARPAARFKLCNQNTAALTKASRITRTALHARPETTRSLSRLQISGLAPWRPLPHKIERWNTRHRPPSSPTFNVAWKQAHRQLLHLSETQR